jgi:hypothetical protein
MARTKRKGRKAAKGKGRKRSRQGTAGGVSKWEKFNTNSLERRMGTRKENRCQLCLTKAPLDEQFTVVNDLEAGTVKKSKNASADKNEHLSHYCGDCADKRVTRKEYWMESVREASGPDQRGKTGGGRKKKAAKKKRVRGKKAKGKKGKAKAKGKAPRKRNRKSRAKSDAKPKRQRRRSKAKAASAESEDEPF